MSHHDWLNDTDRREGGRRRRCSAADVTALPFTDSRLGPELTVRNDHQEVGSRWRPDAPQGLSTQLV